MKDEHTQNLDIKQTRGLEIAKKSRITKTDDGWHVPSQYGNGSYLVTSNENCMACNCPDYLKNGQKCKHIWAVKFIESGQIHENLVDVINTENTVSNDVTPVSVSEMESLTNEGKKSRRKTYSQDWRSYNRATVEQKSEFMKILKDITDQIGTPDQSGRRGRPRYPRSEMIYSAVMKTYSTFSLRRAMGELSQAKKNEYIEIKPSYTTVGRFIQSDEATSILSEIVKITSSPLCCVESKFATDSTGFGTSCFQRWYSFKHGKEIRSKRWVKCHFITGVKTNIITCVKITSEFEGDSPQLPELIKQTTGFFNMTEMLCDRAYSSRNNLEVIAETGAFPGIPFKVNAKPSGNGSTWMKLYYYYMLNQEEFYKHYHQRSNAEATVHMVKSKFGDYVRGKTWTAQVNEVLCKVICHNICVVIQEMWELGIKPDFKFDFGKTDHD